MVYDGREYDGPDWEIEQEAQQDAVQTFIKNNNIWGILGGITFAVLVAAGYLWWQGAQERQALADAGRYGTALQAFQSGNIDQGLDVLAGLGSTSGLVMPCCHGLKVQSNLLMPDNWMSH